ncbi:hypothetical protein K490DRAFT_31609, partial [Saccharata proteae CBS 121410]
LKCLMTVIPTSPCSLTNTTCICTNEAFLTESTLCVATSCTIPDALIAENVTQTICGAPVRDRTDLAGTIGVTGGIIALLAFIMRMMASLPVVGRPLGWDDWTMCALVALAAPPTVFSVILSDNGLGKDIWTLPAENITNVLKYYYFGEIFYFCSLAMLKVSLCCFYLRIFPAKDFRRAIYIVLGLCVAYGIAFMIVTIFQCNPISYAWTQWDGFHEGSCNNIHLQSWLSAALNIPLDLLVCVLPLRNLSQMNMSLKKKIGVMLMFSLGIFVTIVSIVRLQSLIQFANSENITWDYVPAAYWSTIEVHVGIICACMPAHRVLILKLWPRMVTNVAPTKASGYGSSKGESSLNKSINQISIKPKGDDSDFVPLVDVETGKHEWTTSTHSTDTHGHGH